MSDEVDSSAPPPPPTPDGPFGHGDVYETPPSSSAAGIAFYPFTIGRGLSLSWHLYRFGWRTFVGIALIAAVPIAIIEAIAGYLTAADLANWQSSLGANGLGVPADPSAVLSSFPTTAFGELLLASLIAGPIATFAGSALIDAIRRAISGERLSVRVSYRAAFSMARSLVGLYLILTLGSLGLSLLGELPTILFAAARVLDLDAGIGAFLLIVVLVALVFGLIFLLIRIAFALQALTIEHLSALAALRRSWFLLSGSMLRLIGWMAVFGLIVGLAAFLFEIPAGIVGLVLFPPDFDAVLAGSAQSTVAFTVFVGCAVAIGGAIFQPLLMIGSTFLYFEIRWRHGETVPVPGQPREVASPTTG